jgi:hypothetical protein
VVALADEDEEEEDEYVAGQQPERDGWMGLGYHRNSLAGVSGNP